MRHTSLPARFEGDPDVATTSQHEADDIQMLSDGEPTFAPAPPPHIAARFNRTTNTTTTMAAAARPSIISRKSSASSSRRNSISSSLHSGRSTRSSRGGPSSTHVAQHMRRASILEARRARLAERAAHAEQVRMRAQQAKAPTMSRRSAEERAVAAQEARERHLASVAAACAEEVKRAKRVAEDMKERKERDEERLRQEMEEKHANAEERRRLMYEHQREMVRKRRNSSNARGGGLLPAVQEMTAKVPAWKPRTREAAAKVVQRAWRRYRLARTVREFAAMELDVEHVQAATFEDASELLMQDRVIAATERLLVQAHLIQHGESPAGRAAAARTFLSAFLVLCHPQQVLSQHGEQEEDLINKAKVLLMEVQRLLSKPPTLATFAKSSEIIESLFQAFSRFGAAFKAWRDGDSSFLIETMLLQLVELDAIWQTVKNDTTGGVAEDYRQGISQNQTMLMVRLKRLVGPERARQIVRAAVMKRRKEDIARRKALKSKPRGVTGPSSIATPVLEQSRSQLTPPVAREPVFSSKDLAQVIAPLPDNRIVVHELALDKEYRISTEKTREVRQTLRRAAFRAMRDDIIIGKGDDWILSMVETIREKILRTLQKGKSMYNSVSEALDLDLIRQQLAAGTFHQDRFFSYMASILPKLVSPARDAEVRDFARDNSSDFTERLEKLFRIIDYLSLDYANYLLQMSAEQLISRAAEYEQTCFTEQYGPGTKNLPRTKQWWRNARQNTMADLSRRPASPPSASLTPPPTPPRESSSPALTLKPTAERIYMTGLVDLFIAVPSSTLAKEIPETLQLDLDRIADARSSILRIITTSTILLTAKNALKRDVRTPWRNVAQRLWDSFLQQRQHDSSSADAEAMAPAYINAIDSAQALPPAVRTHLSGLIRRVLAESLALQTGSSRDITQPVMRVLLGKLRANVLGRVLGSEEERRRKETQAADALATAGMIEHVERVRLLVQEMQEIKRVDWEAHGKWLDLVREEIDAEALQQQLE